MALKLKNPEYRNVQTEFEKSSFWGDVEMQLNNQPKVPILIKHAKGLPKSNTESALNCINHLNNNFSPDFFKKFDIEININGNSFLDILEKKVVFKMESNGIIGKGKYDKLLSGVHKISNAIGRVAMHAGLIDIETYTNKQRLFNFDTSLGNASYYPKNKTIDANVEIASLVPEMSIDPSIFAAEKNGAFQNLRGMVFEFVLAHEIGHTVNHIQNFNFKSFKPIWTHSLLSKDNNDDPEILNKENYLNSEYAKRNMRMYAGHLMNKDNVDSFMNMLAPNFNDYLGDSLSMTAQSLIGACQTQMGEHFADMFSASYLCHKYGYNKAIQAIRVLSVIRDGTDINPFSAVNLYTGKSSHNTTSSIKSKEFLNTLKEIASVGNEKLDIFYLSERLEKIAKKQTALNLGNYLFKDIPKEGSPEYKIKQIVAYAFAYNLSSFRQKIAINKGQKIKDIFDDLNMSEVAKSLSDASGKRFDYSYPKLSLLEVKKLKTLPERIKEPENKITSPAKKGKKLTINL